MKALIFSLGLGCSQFAVDQFCEFFEQPLKNEITTVIVNERWSCSRCGKSNGEWTSICGRCGRSQ